MRKYQIAKLEGYKFYFKYEPSEPDLLHIYIRHLTTVKDTLKVFFNSEPIYNEKYDRYENSNETHTIFWNWINEPEKIIMIITCFKL